jgi:ParB family chromosome partitioning protein
MTDTARRPNGGLGRGLASLIPQRPQAGGTAEIPLDRIHRNPYQPRHAADAAELDALAASITEHGVIQPVLVVETLEGYQLVAGERRVRAAEMAGLTRIPAVVREATPRAQLELALVENLQRSDLNALEEAHAYRRLIDEFGMSQDEVAAAVGRARPTIANTLRLLELAPEVQEALGDRRVTEGHGRALAGLAPDAQVELLGVVVAKELSVRQTEALARRLKDGQGRLAADRTPRAGDPDLERVESELRTALGTKVTLNPARRGGRIVIQYYDSEDLDRLYERLLGARA